MTELMITLLFIGVFVFFSSKNFFVQIVSIKLALDAAFLFLCSFNKNSELLQAFAWMMMSVGLVFIFIMLVAALNKIAHAKKGKRGEVF